MNDDLKPGWQERLHGHFITNRNEAPGGAERAELNELLRHHPEARAEVARLLLDDSAIVDCLRAQAAAALYRGEAQVLEARNAVRKGRGRTWHPLAAAAAVLLALLIAAFFLRESRAPEFAAYRDGILLQVATHPEHVTFPSSDLDEIGHWLRQRGMTGNIELPAGLRGVAIHGCQIFDWNHHAVALICLVPEGKPHVDLLVIERTAFKNLTLTSGPQLGTSGELATAVWSAGGKTYLLAGRMDPRELRKLL